MNAKSRKKIIKVSEMRCPKHIWFPWIELPNNIFYKNTFER